MIEDLKKFERVIFISLLVMMTLVVLPATLELEWIIKDIITPANELFEIFGLLMLVLIGIELCLCYFLGKLIV